MNELSGGIGMSVVFTYLGVQEGEVVILVGRICGWNRGEQTEGARRKKVPCNKRASAAAWREDVLRVMGDGVCN
jgi:hypothetical protein